LINGANIVDRKWNLILGLLSRLRYIIIKYLIIIRGVFTSRAVYIINKVL
jgi:hypothetical protein